MTKYVGRHRSRTSWTPWKTISSGLVITGFIAIPLNSGYQPLKEVKETTPEIVTLSAPVTSVSLVPHPEVVDGGRAAYEEWVNAGMPGYIPDKHEAKGLVPAQAPEPEVVVIPAECDKPDLLGLTDATQRVYRTVCALFPEIETFGGYRPGDPLDHGSGHAIDVMVYGDSAIGQELADWLVVHANELSVKYVIWQQQIWQNVDGLRQWTPMEDRGSPTANHQDHVHISVY